MAELVVCDIVFVSDIIGVAMYTVFTCVVPGTTVVTAIILNPVARGIDFDDNATFCSDVVNGGDV